MHRQHQSLHAFQTRGTYIHTTTTTKGVSDRVARPLGTWRGLSSSLCHLDLLPLSTHSTQSARAANLMSKHFLVIRTQRTRSIIFFAMHIMTFIVILSFHLWRLPFLIRHQCHSAQHHATVPCRGACLIPRPLGSRRIVVRPKLPP